MVNLRLEIELVDIIEKKFSDDVVAQQYLERLKGGRLTIDENQESHFCVYFAAYDPKAKEIFIGHHKKSGLWLVNGGHIDEGEILQETLKREIDEEWGLKYEDFNIGAPQLLTITKIYNPEKQPCRAHYDIWHFVPVDKNTFAPDKNKLAEEFYENRWKSLEEVRKLITKDASHNKAIAFLSE